VLRLSTKLLSHAAPIVCVLGCAGADLPSVKSGRAPARLLGQWQENFESRHGCSDTTTIFDAKGTLGARGKDCESKLDYAFSDLEYDGTVLRLQLDVPASGYHVHYKFLWLTENDLAGDAAVTKKDGTKTYPVRWTRAH
jgi:hypothetical protein